MNELTGKISAQADRKWRFTIWIVTVLVLLLVGLMRRPELRIDVGDALAFLPLIHAILNTLVALSLALAIVAIKQGNIALHRRCTSTAMLLSTVFLLCYVVYLFLLITHIVAAAVSFPMILFTYLAGWADQRQRHRRLAKWTFPLWFYVAVTGPICYLMLRPYY